MIIRCVAEGKYSSIGRLLMVMAPSPLRRRTRATAALRRPVDWISGLGTTVRYSLSVVAGKAAGCQPRSGDAVNGMVELASLRPLRDMRMSGTGVDLQLLQHLAAERTLGKHTFD